MRNVVQTRDRRHDRLRPGADQQLLVSYCSAIGELDPVRPGIDRRDVRLFDEGDAETAIVGILPDHQALERALSRHVVGKRDARVRHTLLAIEQEDRPVPVVLADPVDRGERRCAVADQDVLALHVASPVSTARTLQGSPRGRLPPRTIRG